MKKIDGDSMVSDVIYLWGYVPSGISFLLDERWVFFYILLFYGYNFYSMGGSVIEEWVICLVVSFLYGENVDGMWMECGWIEEWIDMERYRMLVLCLLLFFLCLG